MRPRTVQPGSRLPALPSSALPSSALLLGLSLLVGVPALGAGSEPPPLEAILAEDAGGSRPSELAWSPDGRLLAYLWDGGDGDTLFVLEPDSGRPRSVVRRSSLRAEGEAPEIDGFVWMPAGDALLLEAGGDLWTAGLDGDPLRRLTETGGEETDPKPSPDGGRVAFVRDHDLWLLELEGGDERRLTHDGEEGRILNGETDWVYWEELWNRDSTGYWWSPEGDRIAFYHFDESEVGVYPLLDPLPLYPERRDQRHPKAGTTNPTVRVGVVAATGGEPVWLATEGAEEAYLPRVHWSPDSRVAVHRLNREQTRLDLLLCGADDGICSVRHTETHPTWINLSDDFRFLADGSMLRSSEATGRRRLERLPAGRGAPRSLTPAGWVLDHLDGVDEAAGVATVTMFPDTPLGARERRVFRVPLQGGEPREIGAGGGWNEALPAPAGGLWVHRWSSVNDPGRQVVRDDDGLEIAALPSKAPAIALETLPGWRWSSIPGPEGVPLPAAELDPPSAGAEPSPVLVFHYGGPGSQVVADRWSGRTLDLWHRWMAARGVRVVAFDNTASLFFPKSGEDAVHRLFGTAHLPALGSVLEYLRGRSDVDPDRIGIWGWSGGGTNTLAALLNYPGSFAAGVAGAPVTDWRLYDTIWTERYLDTPEDNPAGYDASPLSQAANLADPLLIVHGTGDDNVHPQNTLVMANALTEAGKPFEMHLYPNQKHGLKGAAEDHFYGRMTGFFERWLGLAELGAGGGGVARRPNMAGYAGSSRLAA